MTTVRNYSYREFHSVQIVTFVFFKGATPFHADDPMQSYVKIIGGTFQVPDYLSSDASDLIRKFLELRPANRYGCLKNGTKDIKSHQWFSSIDWTALGEKRLPAPFVPNDNETFYDQYDEEPLKSAETALYSIEFESF